MATPVDHPLLLSDEELDGLTDDQLQVVMDAMQAEAEAWVLSPKQQFADELADEVDELLYGGAAGGGKTDWALHRAWRLSMEQPGHRTLMLRTNFRELERSVIERSLEKFDQSKAKYSPSRYRWVCRNGSVIQFGFADEEVDKYQYRSDEYDFIIFEELTQFREPVYRYIKSRCRTTARKRSKGIRPHIIAMTNPGDRGHKWVKDYFVTRTRYGTDVVTVEEIEGDPESRKTIAFVQALVYDNPHMDPDYVRNLKGMAELDRKHLLDGDWDAFGGQFFDQFRRDLHVTKPFTVPEAWERIRGIDYGYVNPTVCLWAAFDWDGKAWVYREYKATRRPATDQADDILRLSLWKSGDGGRQHPERINETVADPSIFARTGVGPPIAQQYARAGLHVQPANNDRVTGWTNVREYLRIDDDGTTHIQFFPVCGYLLDTLPEQVSAETNPEDIVKNDSDHACDTLRYLLMARRRRAGRDDPDRRSKIARHLDRYRVTHRQPVNPSA